MNSLKGNHCALLLGFVKGGSGSSISETLEMVNPMEQISQYLKIENAGLNQTTG